MEWKGIPYSLDAKEIVESVNGITTVAVDKIPTVIVSTSFPWETVVSSIIAAMIPSFIAWYAIRKNFQLAKYQHELSVNKDLVNLFRVSVADFITNITLLVNLIKHAKEMKLCGDTENERYKLEEARGVDKLVHHYWNKIQLMLDSSGNHEAFESSLVNIICITNELKHSTAYHTNIDDNLSSFESSLDEVIENAKVIINIHEKK
ncbi:hypothetical protein [Providencia sp. PROV092]|uniref:hypothetical protein n=1 Tax=Providencia sp. PROV092 TaxID=2949808 RepID=UPI0023499ABF|nr:hypothetical protein [Providencia sp. PROV092]